MQYIDELTKSLGFTDDKASLCGVSAFLHPLNLGEELYYLQQNGKLCDWTLKAKDGSEFNVHKCVLAAASSYFQNLLTGENQNELKQAVKDGSGTKGGTKTSARYEVVSQQYTEPTEWMDTHQYMDLGDISPECLSDLISYIYTGNICKEYGWENLMELYKYSYNYKLQRLSDICADLLIKYIDENNSVKIWKFACDNHLPKLQDRCIEVILAAAEKDENHPLLSELSLQGLKALVTATSEENSYPRDALLKFVLKWAKANNVPQKQFSDLFMEIFEVVQEPLSNEKLVAAEIIGDESLMDKYGQSLSKLMKMAKRTCMVERVVEEKEKRKHVIPVLGEKRNTLKGAKSLTLPEPRNRFGYAVYNEKLLLVTGGNYKDEKYSSCLYYSPIIEKWSAYTDMREPRFAHECAFLNDRIYSCGGVACRTVEYADLSQGTWYEGPSMSVSKSFYGLVPFNGCLYAFGGVAENSRSIEYLDPRTSWHLLATPYPFDDYTKAVAAKNSIYCFNEDGHKARIFDIRNNKFTEDLVVAGKMDKYRYNVCELDGSIYLFGSCNGNSVKCYRINCSDNSSEVCFEEAIPNLVEQDNFAVISAKLSAILSEVQKQGSTKLPSNKSVLVLGDNATGKTTLIAKLQGVEDPKKGSGLEYAYIDVKDEYRDDVTRLGVWVLDGDPGHANLLKFALNEKNYAHTLIILTVSMTTPWAWLEQLQHWIKVLADHIDTLKIDKEERQEARQRLVSTWQTYCEIGDDLDPGSPIKRNVRLNSIDDDDILPLPEGALTTNLGLDMVVVVTKTDYMATLEKEYDYRDEHFDFIQQWIRRFCLQYGASLFYTSVKEDKNCDLLYKYLTHRIYGLPFRTPALVVEKDAVLIPAGWDNLKKISILYENMHSCKAEDYYTDVIVPPPSRKTVSNREIEVQTEDEQVFLIRQQQILQQGQTQTRGESPLRSQPGSKSVTRTPGSTGQSSPKKMDVKLNPSTPGGEGVLANFFNSLLHKKSGSPGASPGSLNASRTSNGTDITPDKITVRNDAAAELDRLARSVKKEMDFTQSDC